MILPKYVAVQAYLESTGTAFADLQYVEPLLEHMLKNKEITIDEGRELLGHKSDVAKTIFNLFQHIGIIRMKTQHENTTEIFTLTNYSRYVLENKKDGQSFAQPLTSFFLSWLPFKIFLKYLLQNSGCDLNQIRSQLGNQILKHTSDVKEYIGPDKIRRGAYMPFNEMVIGKVLANIGEYLGLVNFDKNPGPFFLSPLGKYVTNSLDLLNFQFKNLDPSLNPMHLMFLDLIERGLTNIITFSNEDNLNELRYFHKTLEEKQIIPQIVKMSYNKANFTAMISTDTAYWNFTKRFSNVTYDQIKVLEFNSKVMDYIEIQ
ncbi:MAG: hypothetical protein JXA54_11870 [Candidatus Heimdallarchaeota archaeon]|nr:hypothetical protein [Candidatus Heimdallarchaeota archaeon]